MAPFFRVVFDRETGPRQRYRRNHQLFVPVAVRQQASQAARHAFRSTLAFYSQLVRCMLSFQTLWITDEDQYGSG